MWLLTLTRPVIATASAIIFLAFFTGCSASKNLSNQPASEPEKLEVVSPNTTPAVPLFNFVASEKLSPLLERAKVENKIVFVDFYATWCLPCRVMEEEVYTDKNLEAFFNDRIINYKVDGEKDNGPNLVAIYEVTAYPTLLFLDSNGRVLERKDGAAYQTELRQMAERALAENDAK